MQSLLILGRQPALSLAELESLYGPDGLRPVEQTAALLDREPSEVDFDRLGGSMKLGRVITTLDSLDLRAVEQNLLSQLPSLVQALPEGKIQLGLSVYGLPVNAAALLATGLNLKKALKRVGRATRLVPNKDPELSSASVIYNNLTGPNGIELLIVRNGTRIVIGQTIRVQDINSYTVRDRDRPRRDARIGMLPPKLAQIIINLAVADFKPLYGATLLDPFCGTGVVLQEATLMGYDIAGSDLDARMIEYSDVNLQWLLKQPECPVKRPQHEAHNPDWRYYKLEVGDATNHHWQPAPSFVACETYLGRPFTSMPDTRTLNQTANECNLIISKFLRNIHDQLPAGARLCLAVPAWQVRPGQSMGQFQHLELFGTSYGQSLDLLEDMGYNRISFEHAGDGDLIYFRADQIVARQLLILQKR